MTSALESVTTAPPAAQLASAPPIAAVAPSVPPPIPAAAPTAMRRVMAAPKPAAVVKKIDSTADAPALQFSHVDLLQRKNSLQNVQTSTSAMYMREPVVPQGPLGTNPLLERLKQVKQAMRPHEDPEEDSGAWRA